MKKAFIYSILIVVFVIGIAKLDATSSRSDLEYSFSYTRKLMTKDGDFISTLIFDVLYKLSDFKMEVSVVDDPAHPQKNIAKISPAKAKYWGRKNQKISILQGMKGALTNAKEDGDYWVHVLIKDDLGTVVGDSFHQVSIVGLNPGLVGAFDLKVDPFDCRNKLWSGKVDVTGHINPDLTRIPGKFILVEFEWTNIQGCTKTNWNPPTKPPKGLTFNRRFDFKCDGGYTNVNDSFVVDAILSFCDVILDIQTVTCFMDKP